MSFIPQRISVGTTSSVTGTSGTGAAGRVAYWSGVAELTSDSEFLFDGTSLQVPDGAEGTPSFSFASDTDTGIYRSAANVLAMTAGGARCGAFYSGAFQSEFGSEAAPGIGFIGDENTGLYRKAADTIGVACGGVEIVEVAQYKVGVTATGASAARFTATAANTAGSSAYLETTVLGGSGGDAYTKYSISGVTDWVVGVDNSNSDKFSISFGTALGTNEYFGIRATDGKVYIGEDGGSQTHNIQGDGLSLRRSATGVVFDISNGTNAGGISINGDTGTSAGACLQLYGSGSGNPSYTLFRNANVQTGSILDTGVWSIGPNAGGVTHRFNTNTQATVGAAGAASALPANPTGYWLLNINGTVRAIPYYANA